MITLGQLGTFDVENYGDLLYPLVFRHILKKCAPHVKICYYSFLSGSAPLEADFETTALRSLFDPSSSPMTSLVIGGGDILRTDWESVAVHYRGAYRGYYSRLFRSLGPAYSLQYLLRKRISPQAGFKFYGDQFRVRWMNYPGAGPFLINPDALPSDSIVCYLSCGIPFDFAPSERDEVRRTFDKARFIYLRDEQSREKLKRAGVSRETHVAPDLTVTLSDYFSHAAEAQKGRGILSEWGVNGERPVLCFQSKASAQSSDDEIIIRQLKRYSERTGSEIILLPLGYCHGDHLFLKHLAKKSGGAFTYIGVYSIDHMISVIAASTVFLGTSLHGNITAFSFGIPHLYGTLNVDKAEGFLSQVDLPLELKLRTWSEMNDKLDMLAGLDRAFFSERADKAKPRVYEAVADLLESLLPARQKYD